MSGISMVGKNHKVSLGATKVIGIGTVSWAGAATQMLDDTEFGDDYEFKCPGMITGGTISFAGNAKPGDTTGQIQLALHRDQGDNVTTLRIYINDTSYYESCQTSGYLDPTNTTGANTVPSYVNVTAIDVTGDKGALLQVSFTVEVSGTYVLI